MANPTAMIAEQLKVIYITSPLTASKDDISQAAKQV